MYTAAMCALYEPLVYSYTVTGMQLVLQLTSTSRLDSCCGRRENTTSQVENRLLFANGQIEAIKDGSVSST